MNELKKYSINSGVSVLQIHDPALKYHEIQMWFRTGSANEREEEQGFSHLVEHLLFKVGDKFNGYRLHELEKAGAKISAETSFFYVKLIVHYLPELQDKVLETLTGLVTNFEFTEEDFKAEKLLVLDELSNIEEKAIQHFYHLHLSRYNDENFSFHSYGGSLAGIRRVTSQTIRDFFKKHFNLNEVLFAYKGSQPLIPDDKTSIQKWKKTSLPAFNRKDPAVCLHVPKLDHEVVLLGLVCHTMEEYKKVVFATEQLILDKAFNFNKTVIWGEEKALFTLIIPLEKNDNQIKFEDKFQTIKDCLDQKVISAELERKIQNLELEYAINRGDNEFSSLVESYFFYADENFLSKARDGIFLASPMDQSTPAFTTISTFSENNIPASIIPVIHSTPALSHFHNNSIPRNALEVVSSKLIFEYSYASFKEPGPSWNFLLSLSLVSLLTREFPSYEMKITQLDGFFGFEMITPKLLVPAWDKDFFLQFVKSKDEKVFKQVLPELRRYSESFRRIFNSDILRSSLLLEGPHHHGRFGYKDFWGSVEKNDLKQLFVNTIETSSFIRIDSSNEQILPSPRFIELNKSFSPFAFKSGKFADLSNKIDNYVEVQIVYESISCLDKNLLSYSLLIEYLRTLGNLIMPLILSNHKNVYFLEPFSSTFLSGGVFGFLARIPMAASGPFLDNYLSAMEEIRSGNLDLTNCFEVGKRQLKLKHRMDVSTPSGRVSVKAYYGLYQDSTLREIEKAIDQIELQDFLRLFNQIFSKNPSIIIQPSSF